MWHAHTTTAVSLYICVTYNKISLSSKETRSCKPKLGYGAVNIKMLGDNQILGMGTFGVGRVLAVFPERQC